jgi:hypothetical protein
MRLLLRGLVAGEALLIHEAAIEVLADAVNIRALVTELERDGALDLLAAVSHRRGIQLGPADRALSYASTERALHARACARCVSRGLSLFGRVPGRRP